MSGAALQIAGLYALFAALATVANLGAQRAVLWAFGGMSGTAFLAALAVGTVAGFAVKYLLDRRWIFGASPLPPRDEARRVWRYGLTAVFTTLLFWATEAAFWIGFGTHAARELGAVLGLAAGYTIKYFLDRAYVFRPGAEARAEEARP